MDKIGELDGVSDEEDWSVVSNHVPVSFFSIELDGITSWVSGGICRSLFTSDSGESEKDGGGFSDFAEEFGFGVFADIVGGLKVAMSTCALGMDDSFGDTLSVEVGELVNEVDVIEGDRAILSGGDGVLVIVNRSSV